MFWKKKRKKNNPSSSEKPYEIRAYSKEGGHIKSLERQGLTTSAAYGGMGVRELQLRMELLVEQVLSSNRSVFEPAKMLAEFAKVEQDLFLNSIETISSTSVELAYNFCHFAPKSLGLIDKDNWDSWIVKLLEVYDNKGVNGAISTMKNVDEFVQSITQAPSSVILEEVSRILESFVIGLNGRKLSIEPNEKHYSDTEIIRLPDVSSIFSNREDNFTLYKAMAVHQWAQGWFGTWRMNVDMLVKLYKDPDRALSLFHKLETIRLDACIERELPGIARAMKRISKCNDSNLSKNWNRAIEKLRETKSTVQDSMFFLETIYKDDYAPKDKIYQGTLSPRETQKAVEARIEQEKNLLQKKIAEIINELDKNSSQETSLDEVSIEGTYERFSLKETEDESMPDGYKIELQFDDKLIEPPEDVQQILESILQDLGNIPDEYLEPAGQGKYDANTETDKETDAKLEDTNGDVYFYDEWDHSRQKYRKEWCRLKEIAINPIRNNFVSNTLQKHRSLIKNLHRTFEALREDDKRIKRQPFGDDIDIDAVIEAYTETERGLEASQNLFSKSRKIDRDIAVMFMIDMSGSTAGWINEMEREALVLLCESLEILGDRYAIYGFSGVTHERCELYKVKEFEEIYSDEVKARISGIQPQDYTRMGAAIRHLTKLLHQVEARTKLLITLSDGRPDDQDGYRGPYGIEDTRRALIETKFLGIHPFCITIDEEAMDYLQHMYGAVNFAVIDQVDKLPYKVSDIYRRITM